MGQALARDRKHYQDPWKSLQASFEGLENLVALLQERFYSQVRAADYWDGFLFDLSLMQKKIRSSLRLSGLKRGFFSADYFYLAGFCGKDSFRLDFGNLNPELPSGLLCLKQADKIDAWFSFYRQRLIAANELVAMARCVKRIYHACTGNSGQRLVRAIAELLKKIRSLVLLISTDLYSDFLKRQLSDSLFFVIGKILCLMGNADHDQARALRTLIMEVHEKMRVFLKQDRCLGTGQGVVELCNATLSVLG
jgi:hypothetical protein